MFYVIFNMKNDKFLEYKTTNDIFWVNYIPSCLLTISEITHIKQKTTFNDINLAIIGFLDRMVEDKKDILIVPLSENNLNTDFTKAFKL